MRVYGICEVDVRLVSHAGRFYVCEPPPCVGGQSEVWPAVGDDGARYALKLPLATSREAWLPDELAVVRRLRVDRPELVDVMVPVVDDGEWEGRPFLVMPWRDHRLDHWIRGRGLEDRLAVAAALARAVSRLAREPGPVVVHRDIKPMNAFVVEERGSPRVELSDFGAAGWRERLAARTLTGTHTPGFAPVDQILPRSLDQLDPSWDVYAVAATVYFVLTEQSLQGVQGVQLAYGALTAAGRSLQQPAAGRDAVQSSPRALRELVRLDEIEPVNPVDRKVLREQLARWVRPTVAYDLAERIVAILRPALDPDPVRRDRTAARLTSELEALARSPTPPPTQRRGRRGSPVHWVALVLAAGAASGPPPAGFRYDAIPVEPASAWLGSTLETWAREDDEGRRLVQVTRPFALGRHEVTQRLWTSVMGENPVEARHVEVGGVTSPCADYDGVSLVGPERPVVCVSWCDATRFANALSKSDGLPPAYRWEPDTERGCSVAWSSGSAGWRLPTEAEWALAARAGGRHDVISGSLHVEADRACQELPRFGNVADGTNFERFADLQPSGGFATVHLSGRRGLALSAAAQDPSKSPMNTRSPSSSPGSALADSRRSRITGSSLAS